MRESKFRAWVKYQKEMKDVLQIDFLNKKVYTEADKKNKPFGYFYFQDCELMEYAGRKDKNGKEIFEGDIIKLHQFLFDGNEYEKELIGVIAYDEDMTSFGLTNVLNTDLSAYCGYEESDDFKEWFFPLCLFVGLHEESFEIIGNKHDNPKLLEDKE